MPLAEPGQRTQGEPDTLDMPSLGSDTGSAASPVDFGRHLLAVWRRKWLVLGMGLAALALAAAYTSRQPRVYAASASLVLDLAAPRLLGGQVQDVLHDDRVNYWANKEFTATQYRIIQSRAVASRVVEKLGLHADASFLGLADIQDEEERKREMARMDPAALLQSRISVLPEKDTRLVKVEVWDFTPERAALLANEIVEAYLAESLSLKLEMTKSASLWLEERLRELEQTSKASELAVYDFKKQSDVLSTSLEDRLSIVSERLSSYSAALTKVRTDVAELKARLEAMETLRHQAGGAPGWAEPLVDTAAPALVKELRAGLLEARAQCVLLAQRYHQEHPEVAACQQRVEVLAQGVQRELDNLVGAARLRLAEAVAHERNLMALVGSAKQEAFDINKKQIEFARLQRDATNNQRLYDVVLKQLKDIELSGLARTSNVRVLDAARPSSTPVGPRVSRNLTTGLLLGLILGAALVLGLELLRDRVTSTADVEDGLQLPLLGLFPRIPLKAGAPRSERDLYVLSHPGSAAAECCRAIRTRLLFAAPDVPARTLMVTSSGPEEGKSTVAISLGVVLAQSGLRTLLVDTDMRRPRLHEVLGVPNGVGVSTLLAGGGPLEWAIQKTGVPHLFVLPCGPLPPQPAELLHAHTFAELLEQLAGRFDRVLLDSPPVNTVADAAVLGARSDAVILVLKSRHTSREAARRAVRTLRSVRARLLGAVLNAEDGTEGHKAYGQQGSAPPSGGPRAARA